MSENVDHARSEPTPGVGDRCGCVSARRSWQTSGLGRLFSSLRWRVRAHGDLFPTRLLRFFMGHSTEIACMLRVLWLSVRLGSVFGERHVFGFEDLLEPLQKLL